MPNDYPKCVILIANYKGKGTLYKGKPILQSVLESVQAYTNYKNYSIVICDDNSGDGSEELAHKVAPKADFQVNYNCRQFAANNNMSLERILKDKEVGYVVLMNSDVIIPETQGNWLSNLISLLESDKGAAAAEGLLCYPDGRNQSFGYRFSDRFSLRNIARPDVKPGELKLIRHDAVVLPAVALCIRADALRKIGLLDTNFQTGYEDVDWCLRAKKAGYKLIYDGTSNITHLQGYFQKADPDIWSQDKIFYTILRNQYYFIRKWKVHIGTSKALMWDMVYTLGGLFSISPENGKAGLQYLRPRKEFLMKLSLTLRAHRDSKKLKIPH